MRTRGEGGSEHDQKYAFCTQVYGNILCDMAHNRDKALKTACGNLYVIFFNSTFSLDIPSIFIKLAVFFHNILEGSLSQNLEL